MEGLTGGLAVGRVYNDPAEEWVEGVGEALLVFSYPASTHRSNYYPHPSEVGSASEYSPE